MKNSLRHLFTTKNIGFFVIAFICLLFMAAEIVNNRFWLADFEVYYKAAIRIFQGENLYRYVEDGFYLYKYSPTCALYFLPFSVVSFSVSKVLYWLFLMVLGIMGFYLCIKMLKPTIVQIAKRNNAVILFAFLIYAVHFLRELHLGQVNYLLTFIFILGIYSYYKDRKMLFSALLAISIFIKPFGFVMIPYLLVKKRYNEVLTFIGFSLILAILPLLFYGSVNLTLEQYRLWFVELQIELGNKQGLLDYGNHTIFSVVARYTPIRYILVNSTVSAIYQLVLLSGIGLFVLYFINMNRKGTTDFQKKHDAIVDMALLVSLVPLLSFTSHNAFIFTLILTFVIMLYFSNLKMYEKILAVIGFICIGGNFDEMLGKELSTMVNNYSLVSIGTIILIYLLFSLRKRGRLIVETNQ